MSATEPRAYFIDPEHVRQGADVWETCLCGANLAADGGSAPTQDAAQHGHSIRSRRHLGIGQGSEGIHFTSASMV